MDKNVKIGVLYYLKENSYIQSDILLPIQVGYFETGVDMGIQKDNTDDNRSIRHPIYSEYSGIYWMWKNVHSPYKGVYQHRRSLVYRKNPPPSRRNGNFFLLKLKLRLGI